MEKRTLVAIVLAFAVIFGYQLIYEKFFVKPAAKKIQQQAKVEEKKPVPVEPEKAVIPDLVKTAKTPVEEKEFHVETALYSAVFTTRGGTLNHYEIKKYKDNNGKDVVLLKQPGIIAPLSIGSRDDFNLSAINFNVSGKQDITLDKNNPSGSLIFEYKDSLSSIKRTFTFHNDDYKIDIKDEVSGLPDYWITLGTDFGIFENTKSYSHVGPVLLKDTDRIEFVARKLKEPRTYKEGLRWIAQEDKYFFASLVPLTKMEEARVWKLKDSIIIAFRGKPGTNSFFLYAGPKDHDQLVKLNAGLEYIIDFGFFSIIARPLFWLLKFFYSFIGNYGWAIILLTIVIRIPFIPLVNKSQKSMKKMQEIQPKLAELKEKYKKDPQKMQGEMMQLYKKYKVNPLGGCLPLVLQIPVFFALYKILLIAIELRGAPFILWIKDLSAPDTLFGHIPSGIPLIGGFAFGPLPILMGVTMLIQQKMTPSSMDPRQNKMMMIMSFAFMFIFLNFASGLVLYWLMNNVLSIVQQFYINKKHAKESA